MLFNSIDFAVFFVVFLALYLKSNHKWQNILLLVGGYVFYGWWDWRFLSIIFLPTVLDYYFGIKIDEASNIRKRKFFLFLSVFCSLSILGFFKYFNFFAESTQILLQHFGINAHPHD